MADDKTTAIVRLPAEHAIIRGPLGSSDALEHAYRVCTALAAADVVPEHMRKPANLLVALHIAATTGQDVFAVIQGMQIIKGKVGFSGTYLLARINASGLFKGRLRLIEEGSGEDLRVIARATDQDGEIHEIAASMAQAKADGWVSNPKYKSIPGIMLRNRAVAMFARYVCPEVMLGFHEVSEIEAAPEAPTLVDAVIIPPEPATTTTTKPARASRVPTAKARAVDPAPQVIDTPAVSEDDDGFGGGA